MLPKRRMLLVIAVCLISGVVIGTGLFAFVSGVNQSKQGESIGFYNIVEMKAYRSNGQQFYSAIGHNTLRADFGSILSYCASGYATNAPKGFNAGLTDGGTYSCSQMVLDLYIANSTFGFQGESTALCGHQIASNPSCGYLESSTNLPTYGTQVCDRSFVGYCTGWNSTATFVMSANSVPFTVVQAGAGLQGTSAPSFYPSGYISGDLSALDAIALCTSAGSGTPSGCQQSQVTLNPGDSLVVTIIFTISGIV